MKNSKLLNVVLWALLILGFIGAAKVSYQNFTGSPCPHIASIPICYVVLAAYGLMMASMLIAKSGMKHYLFCIGWGTAFVIALAGSVAEVTAGGGVCPTSAGTGIRGATSGSIPLCFASLAMLVVILILFLSGPYKRACDIHNSKA